MPANIRYVAQDSNRLRSTSTAGLQYVMPAILTVSNLAFQTDKKLRVSYGSNPETIVMNEVDLQDITLSYFENINEDDGSLKQAREWYKKIHIHWYH